MFLYCFPTLVLFIYLFFQVNGKKIRLCIGKLPAGAGPFTVRVLPQVVPRTVPQISPQIEYT